MWLLVAPTVIASVTAFAAFYGSRCRLSPPSSPASSKTVLAASAVADFTDRCPPDSMQRGDGRCFSLYLALLGQRAAARLDLVPRSLCAATRRAAATSARARRSATRQRWKAAKLMLLTASLACSPMWDIAAMQMPLGSSLAVSVVSTIRSCIQADAVPAWAHAVRNWSHGLHGSSCAIASHAINFCVHLERAGQSPPPAAVSFFPLPPPSHFPRSAPPLPNPEPPPPLWPPSPPELLMPPAFSLRAPVQHIYLAR